MAVFQVLFENQTIEIKDGYVEKPKTYGLGLTFIEKIVEQFSYKEKINTMISTSNNEIKLTVWFMKLGKIARMRFLWNF